MGRVEQTVGYLSQGRDPVQIAGILQISLGSVLSYLNRAVGEGMLRRSDIYFSFPPEMRAHYSRELQAYSDARAALGDMYDDVRRIEVSLHNKVRSTLVTEYGDGEIAWWRQGVPELVRVKCHERREKDPDDPCDPYCYTDLLDLGKIIEGRWDLFKDQLPRQYANNKKLLLQHLVRLNLIRNKVMHPVRGIVPCEDDFDFVRQLERDVAWPST